MKKIFIQISLSALIAMGCTDTKTAKDIERWKAEVAQTEKDFNNMAQKEGLAKAFAHFAAADGVIRRGKKIIRGKKAIEAWYRNDARPNETLSWIPTFVDVGDSGNLAYTYGDYIFTSVSDSGVKKESRGIFHTVWKRQADGSWRFVWD